VVRLVVTGGSLTRRPKRSLRCLLVEVWQNPNHIRWHYDIHVIFL